MNKDKNGPTISDAIHTRVSENNMFMVISPELCLLEEAGWKAVRIGLVVDVVVVDIVVDLSITFRIKFTLLRLS